jgi:hypothetical protein
MLNNNNPKHLLLFLAIFLTIACRPDEPMESVEQWGVFELSLEGKKEGNPYMDISLDATFSKDGDQILVPGFYDGDGQFKIRFSPPSEGEWRYETSSNDKDLDAKTGKVQAAAPEGNNHGPLKILNTFYLQYADGTPYFGVGTTAYQWTSVKKSIQEQTLSTLRDAPFNKIRMCVFPKSYQYGNETEPWAYPFQRQGEENDYTQPNYEFFQNFDKRVEQLMDMDIQADVILFHPYDKWGYSEMGREMNEKYVRYMMARISAYRNVWWSLANEWDIPSIKESIDWEGIGSLLQKDDPHQRFRGIHNWYGSEDHFYDHTRPWITHTSTQTSQFYNAQRWREMYQQPLLFDEMRYEGDVQSGWGNLSGEEMASYFWMAGLSGGYPTHGDTFQNDSDEETEVRWWAKGGNLPGESPQRISFFKEQMESIPFHEMQFELHAGQDNENLEDNIYLLTSPGQVYMAYSAAQGKNFELNLEEGKNYTLKVLDTWNMETLEEKEVEGGNFAYTSQVPYTALILKSK